MSQEKFSEEQKEYKINAIRNVLIDLDNDEINNGVALAAISIIVCEKAEYQIILKN